MDTGTNAAFGLLFLTLGFAAVFLMFKIWGYPFDEERHVSSAPRWLVAVHRVIGISYVVLYIILMYQMVPRLFEYQVEFPPRTVAHLMLGVTIGLLLILKLAILRAFNHFSGALPYIGTALLWCTTMVVSLSVPFAYKDRIWSGAALGGSAFSAQNLERVSKLLATAGFDDHAPLDELATVGNLKAGRDVLLRQCVTCHDLKTVLTRPRTPSDWVKTVTRMADRQIFDPIEEQQQWAVSAYLIAISPELQSSAKRRRVEAIRSARSLETARAVLAADIGAAPATRDLAAAAELFEESCSMCHDATEVEAYPLSSIGDVRELLERMVENGLDATADDMETLAWYLNETYVR